MEDLEENEEPCSSWVNEVSLRKIITEEAFMEDLEYFQNKLSVIKKPNEKAIKEIISSWDFAVPQNLDLLNLDKLCQVYLRIINYRWLIIRMSEIINEYANPYESAYSYLLDVASGLQSAKNVSEKKSVARFRLKHLSEETDWAKSLKSYVQDYIKVIESMTITLQSAIKMFDLQRAVHSKYAQSAESYSYNNSTSSVQEDIPSISLESIIMKPARPKRISLKAG